MHVELEYRFCQNMKAADLSIMVEILPIRRKTLFNQSINLSINQSLENDLKCRGPV